MSEDTNTEIGSSDGVLPSVEKQQAREAASDAKLDRVVREAALEIYTRPDHDELAVSNAEAAVSKVRGNGNAWSRWGCSNVARGAKTRGWSKEGQQEQTQAR